ncbi:MAG: hypothetical protein HC897_19880 [Thermoanaerobaculia bacterium]|nr:hypothetical protein [Thermoanaerobaculia bacterium]
MSNDHRLGLRLLAILLALAPLRAARASDTTALEKLSIHGFLTQAYAWTDGSRLLGITEDGTSDYRNVALQFRYQMSDDDTFLVQLAHTREGESLAQQAREDVELDWAFYQRKLPYGALVKIGRVPIPIGIYNEVRDVGTVLPFYAPPVSIYDTSSFTNETIDGLVLVKNTTWSSGWGLESAFYVGDSETIEVLKDIGVVGTATTEGYGFQLWLTTPLQSLRVGTGFNKYSVSGGLLQLHEKDHAKSHTFSIDGDFNRVLVHAEYLRRDSQFGLPGLAVPDVDTTGSYLQVGFRVTPKLTLWGQVDRQVINFNLPFLNRDIDFWEDVALSASYAVSSNVIFRVEYHQNDGYFAEDQDSNVLLGGPPISTDYGIVSLSASF